MRVLALMVLMAVPAQAEIVREMTPDRVREAMTWGATQKEAPVYRLKGGGWEIGRGHGRIVMLSTPYSRTAGEAFAAKRDYRTIEPGVIDAALLEPYIVLYAPADRVQPGKWTRASVKGVRKIVVTGPKGADPIHPLEESSNAENYHNAFGGEWAATGVTARFPLTAVQPDAEVHVIYDDGKDATFRFDMAKIR